MTNNVTIKHNLQATLDEVEAELRAVGDELNATAVTHYPGAEPPAESPERVALWARYRELLAESKGLEANLAEIAATERAAKIEARKGAVFAKRYGRIETAEEGRALQARLTIEEAELVAELAGIQQSLADMGVRLVYPEAEGEQFDGASYERLRELRESKRARLAIIAQLQAVTAGQIRLFESPD